LTQEQSLTVNALSGTMRQSPIENGGIKISLQAILRDVTSLWSGREMKKTGVKHQLNKMFYNG
jgi:hypothetical protein